MFLPRMIHPLLLALLCLSNITIDANCFIKAASNIIKYGIPAGIVTIKAGTLGLSEYLANQEIAKFENRNNLKATSYIAAEFDPRAPLPANVFYVCSIVSRNAQLGKGVLFHPRLQQANFGAVGRFIFLNPTEVARIQEAVETVNYNELTPCLFWLHHEIEHIRHKDAPHCAAALLASYAASEATARYIEKIMFGRKIVSKRPLTIAAASLGLFFGKITATKIGHYGYSRYQEKRADYKALQYFTRPDDVERIIQEHNRYIEKDRVYVTETLKFYTSHYSCLTKLNVLLSHPPILSLACLGIRSIKDPTHPSFSSRIKQAERYKAQLLAQQNNSL